VNTSFLPPGGLALLTDDRSAQQDQQARQARQAMRERIHAEREARPPALRDADAWGLAAVALEQPEIASARCVAAYVSTPAAPGTAPLLRALRAGGVRVLLPVLSDDGHLTWSEGLDGAEVAIVPALAVDTLGNRLGHGTDLYDRVVEFLDPTVPLFAAVHETEVLDAAVEPVPVGSRDRPVDAVLTPRRCLRLPSRR